MNAVPESGSDIIQEGISTHLCLEDASKYIEELIKFSCLDAALVTEENYQLYSSQYHTNRYLPGHPFYESEEALLKKRQVSFDDKITNKIKERREKVFKNGLHKKQQETPIKIEVLTPTDIQLEKIQNGELEWVMRFIVTQHLTPRYIKDGDKGEYPLVFEVYISEFTSASHILKNNVVLNTSNRQYKIGVTTPKKTTPTMQERDASIKRSRDAYRNRLVNVLRIRRKNWQKK